MEIRITTNATPPVTVDPFAKKAPAPTNPVVKFALQLLKPTVDASGVPLLGQVHYAPYGDADPETGMLVIYALAALAVVGLFLMIRGVFKR